MPKLLKFPTNCVISTGVVEKITKGSVIFRNCVKAPAPSREAASYSSGEMLLRSPVIISIREGVEIHAFTNSPIPLAHHLAEASFVRKKTRIMPVKDVVEPRCKLTAGNEVFPGMIGDVDTVGEGATLVLEGAAVVTTGRLVAPQEGIIDMSGPGAELLWRMRRA